MIAMAAKSKDNYWGEVVSIRAHQAAKDALTMIKARLRSSPTLRFRGRRVTEEVIFGALCLWAEDLSRDAETMAGNLAPYVARLEALVGTKDDAAKKKPPGRSEEGEVEGITERTINRKGKGKPGRLSGLGIHVKDAGQAI